MAERFTLFAGPCLVESQGMILEVARHLVSIVDAAEVDLVLKGSYRKANRTSIDAATSIGERDALRYLRDAGRECGIRTITDVHSVAEVDMACEYVDLLQIPAFLCRQTDLLLAAGRSGAGVNIKKGQFMAPEDMSYAVEKVRRGGADEVYVCERGTTFGYHNLVVDMRGLLRMREAGARVIFDATHSTQKPSVDGVSGGESSMALPLARAAAAVGIDGLFFETHPDPSRALSDAATQIPLAQADAFIRQVLAHHRLSRSSEKDLR